MTTYIFNGNEAAIDKQTTSASGTITSFTHSKFFLSNDRTGLFMACGDISDIDLLFSIVKKTPHQQESDYYVYLTRTLMEFQKTRKEMGAEKSSDGDMLAIFLNLDGSYEAFSIYDMHMLERESMEGKGICGSGSGYHLAQGAYYVRGRMRDAMNVASWRDACTCGIWDTFTIEKSVETASFEFKRRIVRISNDGFYDSIRRIIDRCDGSGLNRSQLDEVENEFIGNVFEHIRKLENDALTRFVARERETKLQSGLVGPRNLEMWDLRNEDNIKSTSVECLQSKPVGKDNVEMCREHGNDGSSFISRDNASPVDDDSKSFHDETALAKGDRCEHKLGLRGVLPRDLHGECDHRVLDAIKDARSGNPANFVSVDESIITTFTAMFGGTLSNQVWFLSRSEIGRLADCVTEGDHLFSRKHLRDIVSWHKTHFRPNDLIKIPLKFIPDILYDATVNNKIMNKKIAP